MLFCNGYYLHLQTHSAYMLFYERCLPEDIHKEPPAQPVIELPKELAEVCSGPMMSQILYWHSILLRFLHAKPMSFLLKMNFPISLKLSLLPPVHQIILCTAGNLFVLVIGFNVCSGSGKTTRTTFEIVQSLITLT